MARFRDPIPDDLKEFISLCRAGKLFAVQRWIAEGKRFRMPEGNFTTWPLKVTLETGFHSLAEVLLQAGVDQDEKDYSLSQAISERRLDFIELLVKHGADVREVNFEEVICCRHPMIIRWFVERGIDMETGWPIAYAFRYRHREFLGIYMGLRDKVPSAHMQATMALRVHAREGNLKWVSLLMWAGADPRVEVPDFRSDASDDDRGTALAEALRNGREEIVRKIGIDPARDDPNQLLGECTFCDNPSIIKMLIDAGADPNWKHGERSRMDSLFRNFEWAIDGRWTTRSANPALECIEIAARAGGRWRPTDGYQFRCFRTALGRSDQYSAIGWLRRLIDCGAIEKPIFKELMRTPKMRQLLMTSVPGAIQLRNFTD